MAVGVPTNSTPGGRRMVSAVLFLTLAQPAPAVPVTYRDVVAAALSDARSRPPGEAAHTRYLRASHIPDDEERAALYAVTGYQVNSLSRQRNIVRPRKVTPWLWAVNTRDYGDHFAAGWEAFAADNPFWTLRVELTLPERTERRYFPAGVENGRPYAAGEYDVKVPGSKKAADIPGFWLPPVETAELVLLTGSATPVVDADYFFVRTCIQRERAGNGYLDFLYGVKRKNTRQDMDDLIRHRQADEVAAGREVYAVIMQSDVKAKKDARQIDKTGRVWRTGDVRKPVGRQNPVDNYHEDYQPDAREYVFALLNGMPGWGLSDGQDRSQDAAPNDIVGDSEAPDHEHVIDVGTLDCLRCHKAALIKPRKDHGRLTYVGGKTTLTVLDPTKDDRIRYSYLTDDFREEFDQDQARFGRKMKDASGLDVEKLVPEVADVYRRYQVDGWTLARVAARAGYPPAEAHRQLTRYRAESGLSRTPADPILSGLTEKDAAIPADMIAEKWAKLHVILQGGTP